ncbi:hypothetical protein AAF712_016670 [Marasmius tenuissimus]|uniref:Uncharacterized protein n=1 Tax=Marasmius tenuissimus TaxID=585030 RepID=A0ABR2Z638_9AGAR
MDSGTIQNQTADLIGHDAYFALIKMQSVGLAYGIYVPIAVAALHITWRRHVRRRHVKHTPTRWLLGLFILIFFATTAWFSLVVSQQYLKFQYIFHPVNGNIPSLKDRQQVVELLYEKLFSVTPFCQGINFLAADSIIVWRALSLWPEKRYLRYIFGFWIFASIAVANGFNTLAINMRAAGDATKVDGWQKLDSSSMLVSLSINIAATALILVKVWQTRQMWGKKNSGRSTPYRILISLIECGLLFCAIQAINASVSLNNGNSSSLGSLAMFVQYYAVMSPILAGMYPSIVLLIVRQQSAIDGETDVFIFENTIPRSEPNKFNLTPRGHGNDANGHNLTSAIRFTSEASDLESGNGTSATFFSRADAVEGRGGSHRGVEFPMDVVSGKDHDGIEDSDCQGYPPRRGLHGDGHLSNDYHRSLPVEISPGKDAIPQAL